MIYEDVVFQSVSPLMFDLFLRGAKKIFNLEYSGMSTASASYGGQVVGPEVWKSKNSENVLMAFRGSDSYEIAIFATDPAVEADPVPDFMKRYGDDVLDDMVTRVNFQKIVAADEWAEDAVAVPGGGSFTLLPEMEDGFSSYLSSLHWESQNTNIEFRGVHGRLPDSWVMNKNPEMQGGETVLNIDWSAAQAGSDVVSRRPLSIIIYFESIVEGEYELGIVNELTIISGAAPLWSGPLESGVEIVLPWDTNGFDQAIESLQFSFNCEAIALITDIRFNDTDATSFAWAGGGAG